MTRSAGERRRDESIRPAASRVEAVTLQFQPDWPHAGGKVIESMAGDRHYRSQFATGISNGGLTAFPGRIEVHPGFRASPDDRRTRAVPKTDYDEFAEAYSADNEGNLLNGYYERPAMLTLAGDVAGRRILDAGCGSGPLAAALRDRGAIMTGFDLSAAMIELARRRLGEGVDLMVHDLAEPLPYADAAFDDVMASLVLHYLEDWTAPLAEFRRVLKPAGRLIASVNHPFMYTALNPNGNYFDVAEFSFDAEHAGRTVVYSNWHRPLQAMTDAFTAAGFRVSAISEPPIATDTPSELIPPTLEGRRRFISFIFFVLEAC